MWSVTKFLRGGAVIHSSHYSCRAGAKLVLCYIVRRAVSILSLIQSHNAENVGYRSTLKTWQAYTIHWICRVCRSRTDELIIQNDPDLDSKTIGRTDGTKPAIKQCLGIRRTASNKKTVYDGKCRGLLSQPIVNV